MLTARRHAATVVSAFILSAGIAVVGSAVAQAAPEIPAGSSATGIPSVPVGTDTEVTFESRDMTFYGSLRTPTNIPNADIAVLLLPGSGPTDRNGNQANQMVFPNTLSYLADELAMRGIASLRFDKFGSGRSGLIDSAPDSLEYGFEMQVEDASAAFDSLGELTGTSAARTVVLGHSEGALTALVLQQRKQAPGVGLGLLQPLSQRYLDLLSDQINVSLEGSVQSGQLPEADAEAVRSSLARTVRSLRENGIVPADQHPLLESVGFTPSNERFLTEADRYEPADLAAELPDSLPVIVTCSEKDLNVDCGQVQRLSSAVAPEALTFAQLTSANHGLGEIGPLAPGQLDAIAPLPLSREFTQSLTDWLDLIRHR
ncbi:alpha/beta hydrolase [Rhodococcus erythropolis]|uniref:alpha/beta hydrolase n=1 Tax=Rhodococcus erythropolis TaxID=1833 RepID=UPI0036DB1BD5